MNTIASHRYFSRKTLLVAFYFLLQAISFGSLDWKNREIEVLAKSEDKIVVGTFPFVNSGASPITIISIQPSCTCTTATANKQTYLPKQSGVINATFTVGDRVGTQQKEIQVFTDESPLIPSNLIFRIVIPEPITLSAHELIWRSTELNNEKFITVTSTQNRKIIALETNIPSPDAFAFRTETIDKGGKILLFVRPVSISRGTKLHILITAKFDDGTSRQTPLYVETL